MLPELLKTLSDHEIHWELKYVGGQYRFHAYKPVDITSNLHDQLPWQKGIGANDLDRLTIELQHLVAEAIL